MGRDREVAELSAGLEDAIGGRGRLFLIAGEPGIGKTWLAEHLAGHATEQGTRVLWGRCWEGGHASGAATRRRPDTSHVNLTRL